MFKKLLLLFLLALSVPAVHAQTVAYVANGGANSVSIIDTSTNIVTATIPVGNSPAGVVISPDGTRAYVTNRNDNTVSVIDTASKTAIATIGLGSGSAAFLAITPDGKNLYVAMQDSVVVVSTVTNSVTGTIPTGAIAVAITPDGSRAYVLGGVAVVVIDTASNTVVQSIPVNSALPVILPGIAITPGGGDVYVTGGIFSDVSVIATASNAVVATVSFPGFSGGVAITPDGSRAYVSDGINNVVDVIDTASNTVVGMPIAVGNAPFGLTVTPDSAFVYVANFGDGTVSVISTATNTVVATVPVGSFPIGIAIANLGTPFASFPPPTPSNTNNANRISLTGKLTLAANSSGIDFAHQSMTLTVGGFSLVFPAGTVTQVGNSSQQHFNFTGTLNGLSVTFDLIGNSPNFTYTFDIQGKNVGTQKGPNPVTVTLAIGRNSGSATVNF